MRSIFLIAALFITSRIGAQASPIVIDISNCSPDGTGNVYVTPGVTFSCTLTASGGTPPYNWTISQGALPDSFTLNPTTGVLSGTMLASPANLQVMPVKNRKKQRDRVLLINLRK